MYLWFADTHIADIYSAACLQVYSFYHSEMCNYWTKSDLNFL